MMLRVSLLALIGLCVVVAHPRHYEDHINDVIRGVDDAVGASFEEDASVKIEDDIARIKHELHGFSSEKKHEIKDNLKHIASDARQIRQASGTHASNLKTALQDRLRALELQVNGEDDENNNVDVDFNNFDEPEFADVVDAGEDVGDALDDVDNLSQSLEESDLPSFKVQQAQDNLQAIRSDLRKMKTASAKRRGDYREAARLRTQALRLIIEGQDQGVNHFEEDDDVVTSDAERMISDVQSSSLSYSAKNAIVDNIKHIESDNAQFRSTGQDRWREAMQDRVEALKLQIKQSNSVSREFEEDEESPVMRDASQMMADVEASDLPSMTKSEIIENLQQIQHDQTQFSQTGEGRWRQAMDKRVAALKLQIGSNSDFGASFEEDEDDAVVSDIRQMKNHINQADLSFADKTEITNNLEQIEYDHSQYRQTAQSRWKQAMDMRIAALKLQVGEVDAPSREFGREFEEEDAEVRVAQDVSQMEAAVRSSNIAPATKQETLDNLKHIREDAHQFQATKDPRYKEAIQDRMEALRQEISTKSHKSAQRHAVNRQQLEEDIAAVSHQLKAAHLPASTMKAAKENLAHIKKDAEELAGASAQRAKNLKEALSLRMKALRDELH